MKVEVIKPFRYALRIFEVGEVGEVVEVDSPYIFQGKPLYALYVKFHGHEPVGVFWEEVKLTTQIADAKEGCKYEMS